MERIILDFDLVYDGNADIQVAILGAGSGLRYSFLFHTFGFVQLAKIYFQEVKLLITFIKRYIMTLKMITLLKNCKLSLNES